MPPITPTRMPTDPQAMLQQGGGAGVLPPTSPVQPPQPGTAQDPMMQQLMQGSKQGQEAYGEQLGRMRELAGTVGELQQQQAQLKVPKMGPQIDHGASTLHNIGQILLMAANMTGPGQALNQAIYGPGMKQYATQSGALAERIKGLQTQEQIEEQPMSAAAGLQYHPFQAAGQLERGQAALGQVEVGKMNAQTRALSEQHKNVVQTEANRIRELVGQGKIKEEAARTQLMGVIARERDSVLRDIAAQTTDRTLAVEQQRAAEQDFKTESDHWLQNLFGQAPEKPITPAGAPAKGGGGKVEKWGRDAKGNLVKQ